jgi:hypothetical protein
MGIEYNDRYAHSGTMTQPTNFNFFEPFFSLNFFKNSYAPFLKLREEENHLFDLIDFANFHSADCLDESDFSSLRSLPDGKIYHFTVSGDLNGTSVYDHNSREYVVSGFSMVRLGDAIFWFVLAGEKFTDEEWASFEEDIVVGDVSSAPPWKRKFVEEVIERNGKNPGKPVPLEGTEQAMRTIVTGEFDFAEKKHIVRGYYRETENSFIGQTDDKSVLEGVPKSQAEAILKSSLEEMQKAGPLWSLAESLFFLPKYFESRMAVEKDILLEGGLKKSPKGKRRSRGQSRRYVVIKSLEVVEGQRTAPLVEIKVPHFNIEEGGYWRRLKPGKIGKDRNGNDVAGKTWVARKLSVKNPFPKDNLVYIKDTLRSAEETLVSAMEVARRKDAENAERVSAETHSQELYILRCANFEDDVYKVGWTSGSSYVRAKELSQSTGVPTAFSVLHYWRSKDAEGLEADVHAQLLPYRVSNTREFFKVGLDVIYRAVEMAL